MTETPLLDHTVSAFLNWCSLDETDLSGGLKILAQQFGVTGIVASVLNKPEQGLLQSWQFPQSATADLRDLAHQYLLDQADTYTQEPQVRSYPLGSYHAKSFSHQDQSGTHVYDITLYSEQELDVTGAEILFLKMACQALLQKMREQIAPDNKVAAMIVEAFNALDDAVIVFDPDLNVIAFNERQRSLFPSVSSAISVGVSYDRILRKQLEVNPLSIPPEEHEAWIQARKTRLRQETYREEQKFGSGETIRLTSHKTPSGGAVTLRSNITELVAARQQAFENEQLFRALLIGAPIALVIISDTEILYANATAEDFLDAEEGQLVGMGFAEISPDLEFRKSIVNQVKEYGHQDFLEHELVSLQGRVKKSMMSVRTITFEGTSAYFVSFIDFTELVETQTALRLSEQQNRNLLEMVPEALIVQVDGIIKYVNPAAALIFNAKSVDDMIGKPSLELAAPEIRDTVLQFRSQTLSSGAPDMIRAKHVRYTGEVFLSEIFSQSVTWNGKKGTLSFIRDLNTQIEYEQKLIRNENEMQLAQTIGQFGHWRIDPDSSEIYWSDELFRIHGLEPSTPKIPLAYAASFIHEEDQPKLRKILKQVLEKGEAQDYHTRVVRADGQLRYVEGKVHPTFDSDGNVTEVFGVSQDVTDRFELENRLKQSQKMEAIGQLTGGIAHDFNNLLAVILGNAELLLEALPEEAHQQKTHIHSILNAAERGSDLTMNMLAFGRTQMLKPQNLNLNDHVHKMVQVLNRTLEENIEIKENITCDLWTCKADPGQLENAILNIAINARDAMPNGGKITFRSANVYLDGTDTMDDEKPEPGDYVCLSVSDTGAGIPKDQLPHVFEPFFTTKEVGKGTGLGLSMVYGFVKQSKGYLQIKTTPGQGTQISFYFPRLRVQENLKKSAKIH